MLSPSELELLTGHVDGELTVAQRRQVTQLLHTSGEAREFVRLLEDDSSVFRRMPRLTAPMDLSDSVLEAIAKQKKRPAPTVRPVVSQTARVPVWVGWAAAAAILLVVGIGSFWLHSESDSNNDPSSSMANSGDQDKKHLPEGPARHERDLVKDNNNSKTNEDSILPPPAEDRVKDPMSIPEGIDRSIPPSDLRSKPPRDPVLASGGTDGFNKLERVDLALPTVFRVHELDRAAQNKQLFDQLQSTGAFRIEVLARDASRGFDRIRAAFESRKVQLLIDPPVHVRLKKPVFKTDYAFFFENVTPEAVIGILRYAGLADRRAGEKKSSEMRLEGSLVVKEMARWDRKELHDLLGVDPVGSRPTIPLRTPISIKKPLVDDTTATVTAALEGKGLPRPGVTHPLSAYVTTLSAARGRSVELKRFLDSRRPPVAGTIQVFLILRQLGA
jgi:hypothetical protein